MHEVESDIVNLNTSISVPAFKILRQKFNNTMWQAGILSTGVLNAKFKKGNNSNFLFSKISIPL